MSKGQCAKYAALKRCICRHYPVSMSAWTNEAAHAMWDFEKAMGIYKEAEKP